MAVMTVIPMLIGTRDRASSHPSDAASCAMVLEYKFDMWWVGSSGRGGNGARAACLRFSWHLQPAVCRVNMRTHTKLHNALRFQQRL